MSSHYLNLNKGCFFQAKEAALYTSEKLGISKIVGGWYTPPNWNVVSHTFVEPPSTIIVWGLRGTRSLSNGQKQGKKSDRFLTLFLNSRVYLKYEKNSLSSEREAWNNINVDVNWKVAIISFKKLAAVDENNRSETIELL